MEVVFAFLRGNYDANVDEPADAMQLGGEVDRLRQYFCRRPGQGGAGAGPINDGAGPRVGHQRG